jgi:hypothetical protein
MLLSTQAQPSPQPDNGPLLLPLADGLWGWSALYRLLVPYLRDIPPVVQQVGPSGILGGEGVVRAGHPTTPVHFFVYQSPPEAQFEAAWALTEAIIKRLRDEVESRGARLAVVIIGAPEQVYPAEGERLLANPGLQGVKIDFDWPNRRLNNFLAAQNIPHLDLLPIFRQAAADPKTPPLHFRHDGHWTVAGHRLAAEAIYEFLQHEPDLIHQP